MQAVTSPSWTSSCWTSWKGRGTRTVSDVSTVMHHSPTSASPGRVNFSAGMIFSGEKLLLLKTPTKNCASSPKFSNLFVTSFHETFCLSSKRLLLFCSYSCFSTCIGSFLSFFSLLFWLLILLHLHRSRVICSGRFFSTGHGTIVFPQNDFIVKLKPMRMMDRIERSERCTWVTRTRSI